jgi:sugar phosphate isomerase/epimerase
MKLAFYTYSYTDRLRLPVAECLARIAKAGYAGIDESATFGASEDPRSVTSERRRLVRDTARQYGLTVEAVVTHAELTATIARRQPLDLPGTADLAADLGANLVTFHMGGAALCGHGRTRRRSTPDRPDEDVWRSAVEVIRAAVRADARRVSMAVDGIWPGWIVHSPETLQRLFDEVGEDGFGVNFDPCYLTLMGLDPAQFVRRFAARIRHAHLKDHVGRYPTWEHRIPGQGEMDYVRVFAALAEAGFTGSMAVECFPDMPFAEACDRGYAAMSAALRKAGI